MSEVWEKVDGMKWDNDGGKAELERLRREGFVLIEPIELHPVPDEDAYWIRCEAPFQED